MASVGGVFPKSFKVRKPACKTFDAYLASPSGSSHSATGVSRSSGAVLSGLVVFLCGFGFGLGDAGVDGGDEGGEGI